MGCPQGQVNSRRLATDALQHTFGRATCHGCACSHFGFEACHRQKCARDAAFGSPELNTAVVILRHGAQRQPPRSESAWRVPWCFFIFVVASLTMSVFGAWLVAGTGHVPTTTMCLGVANFSCLPHVEESGTFLTVRWLPTWNAELSSSRQPCKVVGELLTTSEACERERLFVSSLSSGQNVTGVPCYAQKDSVCFVPHSITHRDARLGQAIGVLCFSLPTIFLACVWCFAAADLRRQHPAEAEESLFAGFVHT